MTPLNKERATEIVNCGRNPIYFINEYMKVQHPERGTIPFKTYPFQDDVIQAMLDNRFNIVLKSRQLGLSTITAAYAVWLAIFHKDKNILIIATKKAVAQNLMKKVQFMLKSLPPWMVMTSYEETQTSLRFGNGSEIKAVPTSPDAGRSEALSLLIVDEAAIIKDFDDIWTGLSPTLSTGGSAIVLSTPYGVGGMYYKLWTEARAGLNNFNPIELPWTVHPEHDEKWFIKETANMPKKKISQEFLCDFLSSGDTFLQPNDIEYLHDQIRGPREMKGPERNIWIWRGPVADHKYVISADVARGDSADYSAFHIIDVDASEVVGEYLGKIPPEKLAVMMMEMGKDYNTALLCPENNTFGYATCVALKAAQYPKLYYENKRGDIFNQQNIEPEDQPGFGTFTKSRIQILTKLEEVIRNRTLKIHSQRFHDQMQSFVWQGNKAMAMKDAHDDLVMSLAIGCWLSMGTDLSNADSVAMSIAMLKATHVVKTDHSVLPGVNDVRPVMNPGNVLMHPGSVYRPRDPSQVPTNRMGTYDFRWLLK